MITLKKLVDDVKRIAFFLFLAFLMNFVVTPVFFSNKKNTCFFVLIKKT